MQAHLFGVSRKNLAAQLPRRAGKAGEKNGARQSGSPWQLGSQDTRAIPQTSEPACRLWPNYSRHDHFI